MLAEDEKSCIHRRHYLQILRMSAPTCTGFSVTGAAAGSCPIGQQEDVHVLLWLHLLQQVCPGLHPVRAAPGKVFPIARPSPSRSWRLAKSTRPRHFRQQSLVTASSSHPADSRSFDRPLLPLSHPSNMMLSLFDAFFQSIYVLLAILGSPSSTTPSPFTE